MVHLEHDPRHDTFRLSPGAFALALSLKYLGLALYGAHAAVVEVPSFVEVGGSLFATLWACTIAVLSLLALAAVVRTWMTGRYRLEKWATAALVLAFLTYSVVLVVRGALSGNWAAIPLAWLPVILTALPAIHYYTLVARGSRGDR